MINPFDIFQIYCITSNVFPFFFFKISTFEYEYTNLGIMLFSLMGCPEQPNHVLQMKPQTPDKILMVIMVTS